VSRIDDALRDLHSLDAIAARPTALAHLDPRAKILATLAFIVAVVSFDRYAVAALLPFALFPVALAALGEVPLRLIGRKLLIASPFALMVGMFNPLIDRVPLVELSGIDISGGWVSFVSILLRFALTVAAALVLVASTGFHNVCAGLGRLGAPHVFTTQLLFLYRYAYVLAGEAARMSAARELRACGQRALRLPVYASLLGHLLLRALERAQRIHMAMVSRGFDGDLRGTRPMRWRNADTIFVAGCGACFVLARSADLPHLLGGLLIGVAP
jgi:cobalt/nickel transport system permease protein